MLGFFFVLEYEVISNMFWKLECIENGWKMIMFQIMFIMFIYFFVIVILDFVYREVVFDNGYDVSYKVYFVILKIYNYVYN